jgi:microcystin-dependent protein
MAFTPLTGKVDGDKFTTAMWTNLKDNFDALYPGHIICTSSTRPSTPAEGQMVYETDTDSVVVWNGTVWDTVYPIVPAGTMTQFAGASAPTGYLLCNGDPVSRTTYSRLYTALGGSGSPYGQGNGSTTFNVPDLRGRAPVGAGTGAQNGASGTGAISLGTSLSIRARGEWFGGESHSLSESEIPAHNHTATVSDSGHGHTVNQSNAGGHTSTNVHPSGSNTNGGTFGYYMVNHSNQFGTLGQSAIGDHGHSVSVNTNTTGVTVSIANKGGGGSHNNVQPSLVVNYIIKF